MKNLILFILFSFCLTTMNAQIVGEGELITKSIELSNIYQFESNLYAEIVIDMSEEAGITISAQANIIDYISINNKNGKLTLGQKKWIEPSKRIKIYIGAPRLRGVTMDTHDKLKVINVIGDIINIDASIGQVVLSGKIDDLKIKSKNGNVDASELVAKVASIDIDGEGKVIANVVEAVSCDISEDGEFTNLNEGLKNENCDRQLVNAGSLKTRYIDLKIKNNSFGRKHFVVVGPKPDGRSFSYGFPMMPGSVKSERWTVGTKIYKEGKLGSRKLLVTLTEEDENRTVKLFD